jgi:hypothetical protein
MYVSPKYDMNNSGKSVCITDCRSVCIDAKLGLNIREEYSSTLLKNMNLEMLFILGLINDATLSNVAVAEDK